MILLPKRFNLLIGTVFLLPAFLLLRLWNAYYSPFRMDFSTPPETSIIDSLWITWRVPAFILGIVGISILVLSEMKGKQVSLWIDQQLHNGRTTYVFLFILYLILNSYLLLPGYPVAADGWGAVQIAWQFKRYLQSVTLPLWSNDSWLGYPFTQAGFAISTVAIALIDLAIHDLFLSTKIVLAAFHALSGVTMFMFIRRVGRSAWAGWIAGIAYTLSYFHFYNEVGLGRFPTGVHFALLPLPFLLIERITEKHNARDAGWLALSCAALIWNHLAYGSIAIGLIGLYSVMRLAIIPFSIERRLPISPLATVVVGLILAIMTTSIFIVPTLVDVNLLGTLSGNLQGRFVHGTIALTDILFLWRGTSIYAGYIGLSLFAISAFTIPRLLKRYEPASWTIVIFLLVSLFMSLGPAYFPFFDAVFQNIPLGKYLYSVKSPGHYLIYFVFASSGIAGLATTLKISSLFSKEELISLVSLSGLGLIGIYYTFGRYTPLYRIFDLILLSDVSITEPYLYYLTFAFLLLLLLHGAISKVSNENPLSGAWKLIISALILIDLFTATSFSNLYLYRLPISIGHDTVYQTIRPQAAGRIMDISKNSPLYLQSVLATEHPCVKCAGHETATRTGMILGSAVADQLSKNMEQSRSLTTASINGLYLTNTAYLITNNPTTLSQGFADSVYLTLTPHSPLIVSGKVEIPPSNAALIDLFTAINIDPDRLSSDKLFIKSPSDTNTFVSPLHAKVLNYAMQIDRVDLDFEVSAPAFVQISYAYYPYLKVFLDGKPVTAIETAFGLIGFWADGGTHHVSVRPSLSPTQTACLAVAIISLLYILWLIITNRFFLNASPSH